MTAKKQKADDTQKQEDAVVLPEAAVAFHPDDRSSDGEHWTYQPSSQEFPADQGRQVEQVYVGIPDTQ